MHRSLHPKEDKPGAIIKTPPSTCWLPKELKQRDYFVRSPEELDALILSKPEAKKVRVMYDGDAEELFLHYLEKNFECEIKAASFDITGVVLHIDGMK